MIREVWPLLDAAGMRALDAHTITALGVPGALLMESAGRALAETALERLPRGGRVQIVCGTGNNGGDGLVAARHLQLLGVPVRVALVGEPGSLTGDAGANLARARAAGVPIADAGFEAGPGAVVVDALFGTGLTRAVAGAPAAAIARINQCRPTCPVVSADLPSGVHADSGAVLGAAVQADVTLTFGLPKLGLALEPGRSQAGEVRVARIGIADTAPGVHASAELWTAAAARARLPSRPSQAHKGRFGHVLVAAGSRGKTGAAALAAQGASRAGAGLVTVACPAAVNDVLETLCVEAMTAPLPDTKSGALSAGAEDALLALAAARDVCVLGPGLGLDSGTAELVGQLCRRLEVPLVVDADGLNALAGGLDALQARRAATVLTPHPGEAGRLLGVSAAEVNADRLGAARALAAASGAIVLLKGAGSLVCGPAGRVVVNPTGGPSLASGGTGDVLSGVLGALLAQGVPALDAAGLGAYLHGLAADRIAARRGDVGVMASEVAAEIPAAISHLSRGNEGDAILGGRRTVLSFPEP